MIGNGLYIENPGPNDPILKLQAGLQLSVTVDAPFTSVSADGGIDGSIGVSLKQTGKVYLSPFLATLQSDPLSLFNISGRLGGDVGIKVSVGPADFSIRTPEFTLFSFGDAGGQGGGQGGGGPGGMPRQTAVWSYPGLFGYLEVPSNWMFQNAPAGALPASFGDTTIQPNTQVEYRSLIQPVGMTSLNIGAGSVLQLDSNAVTIDGRASNPDNLGIAYPSENDGTFDIAGTATLTIDGSLANTGAINLGSADLGPVNEASPSVTVNELLYLSGSGTVKTTGAAVWTAAGKPGSAELWNAGNLIEGSGIFEIQVLNEGTIDANGATPLILNGPVINKGLIEATLVPGHVLPVGAELDFAGAGYVDNTHGVILAGVSSRVRIEDGTTIDGGQINATLSVIGLIGAHDGGTITAEGHVTLNGGTDGLTLLGTIQAADASAPFGPAPGSGALTLTGLITGKPGTSRVSSTGDADIVLQAVTVRSLVLSSTGTGNLHVAGGVTLDGSAGPASIGLGGRLLADSTTVTAIGGIAADSAGAEIELTGSTLTIGSASDDGVIFGPDGQGDAGTLFLDNFAVSTVTGQDAASNLSNGWLILGTGNLGAGKLTISNTAAGTIEAGAGGALTVYTAANTIINRGLLSAAAGGDLQLNSNIDNAGGQIAANGGAIGLGSIAHAIKLSGGMLSTTGTGAITLADGDTLDGAANAVTLAAGAKILLGFTETFTGAIVNHTSLSLNDGLLGAAATLTIAGAARLSGGGSLTLNDVSGKANDSTQIITGLVAGAALDNADNTIGGTGLLGNDVLEFTNEAPGAVRASGGTLRVSTRSGAVSNAGLLTSAAGGTLDLRSNVANTGTVSADGGVTELDNDIVTGGSFSGSAGGEVVGSYATIDATQSTVTLLAGARVGVNSNVPGNTTLLTLKGDFANAGAFFAEANSTRVGSVTLSVSGAVRLHGGGQVDLVDDAAGTGNGINFIGEPGPNFNAYGKNTLDNVDNTISGAGLFGGASLAIVNEAAGTISAHGGTLTINDGSSNSIPTNGSLVNQGTLQALGGTLDLFGVIDSRGGAVRAMNDGAGHSGIVLLASAVIQGGTFTSDAADPGSYINAVSGTLDGAAAAVTLGAGSPLRVLPNGSLTWKGSIVNLGTVSVQGNGGYSAVVLIAGSVHLSGGGQVALSDLSATGDSIRGASGTDLLDNADNTISGFGRVGFGAMSLTNEAAGTIAAKGGTLYVAPGGAGSVWTNLGLMTALGGTLDLAGAVSNAGGTIAARHGGSLSGTTVLDGVTVSGGTLAGDAADAGSVFVSGASRLNTLDGTASPVTLDGFARLQVGPTATLTLEGAIVDQGTIAVAADSGAFYSGATLRVSGTVTLGGGGTVSLTDTSGTGGTHTQVITGATIADTLDNSDTISGAGQLGDGTLHLLNEASGIVRAAAGTLIVNTGAATIQNRGRIGAAQGGTLDLQSTVANAGGAIAADGGTVLLDGAAIAGGTLGGTGTGVIAGDGGTLDGTAQAVTVASGTTVALLATVPNVYGRALTLEGSIVNHGTLQVQGDDTGLPDRSQLLIGGAVTLSGGGQVSLGGLTTRDTGADTLLSAAAAGATLENVDNTIAGFGTVGVALTDDALGVVRAQGGTLHLGAVIGAGTLSVAGQATLSLDGPVAAGLALDFLPGGGHEAVVVAKPLTMNAAIRDFAASDAIMFSGSYNHIASSFAGDVLSVMGDGALIGSFMFAGGYDAADFSVADQHGAVTITTSVACYAAGTRIRTPLDDVAVEALGIGDVLLTASGRHAPIRWIGRRSYAGRFLRANPNVQPIRLSAGALGGGLPRRDLLVSPEHAMFLDGLLIPARCLVNGSTIVQDRGLERVDYVHVELEEHDVILAEGAPSESFIDDDSRGMFHNARDFADLYPDAAAPNGFCAPRVEQGAALEAIRRRLAAAAPKPQTGSPRRR